MPYLFIHSFALFQGIKNLGNTCFFNSVIQNLAQTHFLTQLLDVQMQSGQRISLPGIQSEEPKKVEKRPMFDLVLNNEDEENEVKLVRIGWVSQLLTSLYYNSSSNLGSILYIRNIYKYIYRERVKY